ncbi:MAG: HIT family protein [Candidatus Thorarchaeota archaeon]
MITAKSPRLLASERNCKCPFCDAMELGDIGNTPSFLRCCANTIESRLLYETDHFAVLPDLSPITKGHTLVLTKEHYTGTRYIPPTYADELQHVLSYIKAAIQEQFPPPFCSKPGHSQVG